MTQTRRTILGIAAIMLASTLSMLGQDRPWHPDPATMAQHRVEFLTDSLSLTPQQQQQAQTIFTNAAAGSSSVHEQMKAAHDALQTAIKSNDATAMSQAAATIGNLTTQMTLAQAKADAAFYSLLTPDQQAKLAQLPHHGPRGMHGPPPPGMQP